MVDAGVSGATRPAERAGFPRIVTLTKAKALSVLLVYKFDRLAREIRYAVTTVANLAEQHCSRKSGTRSLCPTLLRG